MPSVGSSERDKALYDQMNRANGGLANENRNKLASNMDTFLTLLTTQLKYQDPTSPMDTAQFTQQLVQYSQVEQQISTNEKLDNLSLLYNASLSATAVQYIDNYVEFESDKLPLQDGKARFAYGLGANADSVGITIKDKDGKTVFSTTGELTKGVHEFRWDGKDSAGNKLPDDVYTVSVTAINKSGKEGSKDTSGTGKKSEIDTYTTVFGRVTGVTVSDGEVMLATGKVLAPITKVLSVSKTWDQAPTQIATSPIQYLGHQVEISDTTLPLQNGRGILSYTLPEKADKVQITIKDATGKIVKTLTEDKTSTKLTDGKHTIIWDGKDSFGAQLPDGAYSLDITATSPNGYDIKEIPMTITGTVTSVTTKNGEAIVCMGDVNAPISKIISALKPNTTITSRS